MQSDGFGLTYWTRRGRVGRRAMLRGAGGASAVIAATLAGCSSSNTTSAGNRGAATTVAPPTSGAPAGSPGPAGSAGTAAARAASPAPSVAVKRGGTLTVAAPVDPSSLDPQAGTAGGDHPFVFALFDNLVSYDQKGTLDPNFSLAQAWTITDPTTITLKLRPGVKFHDGTDFNADAAKFNLMRVADPATKSVGASTIASIDSIQTPDPSTVVLKLKNPDAAILANLGDRAGYMMSPTAAQKFGLADSARNPVGTGAFKFVEWMQNDHVTVQAFPGYWGKDAAGGALPYLDRVTWKIIPNATTATASLESGDVDVTTILTQDQQRIVAPKYNVASFSGSAWGGIFVNSTIAPLTDLRVRQAIAYAMDRTSFAAAGIILKELPGLGPLTPAQWAFDTTINVPKFDLAKAKSLLAAAGITGRLKIPAFNMSPTVNQQEGQLYQQQLAAAGIDLDLQTLETTAWINSMFVDRTMPLGFTSFGLRVDPDGIVALCFQSDSYYNPSHAANPKLDALIKQARSIYDNDQRKKLYSQIQETVANAVTHVFVYFSVPVAAGNAKIQNMSTYYGGEGQARVKQLWRSG